MGLIGLPEAAQRAGYTRDGLRRALAAAGVPLVQINAKALAVEEINLRDFLEKRGVSPGAGRPRKQEVNPMAADISEGVEQEIGGAAGNGSE